MTTRFVEVPEKETKPRTLKVGVKFYPRKEAENLTLWVREIEMTMQSGLITLEHQRVSLAIRSSIEELDVGCDVQHHGWLGVFHTGIDRVRSVVSFLAAKPGLSRASTLLAYLSG